MKKKLPKVEETIWCIKLVTLLIIIFGSFYLSAINITPTHKYWYDTWECKNCGYNNYEGIETCPVCGTKK